MSTVTILEGSKIYSLDTLERTYTKAKMKVELIQYKLGFCYYRVGEAVSKTWQLNVKERRKERGYVD